MTNPGLVLRVFANIDAVRQSLANLEPVLATTKASMTQASSAFDGSRVISQGNAAMETIRQLGGVTKLTEAEAARANATLEKAIAKYQALGQEAPKAMRELAHATKQSNEEVDKFGGLVERLTERALILETIHKAFDFAKET